MCHQITIDEVIAKLERYYSEYDLVTDDGVNHGRYRIEECLDAPILRCEDEYVHCALMWSGVTCEECMDNVRRNRKYRRRKRNDKA